MALQSLAHVTTPPHVINIAGPELLSVREVAQTFGAHFNTPVQFEGVESDDALLSHARHACELFGQPHVTADRMMAWIAAWTARQGETLGKPTHFEDRDGRF